MSKLLDRKKKLSELKNKFIENGYAKGIEDIAEVSFTEIPGFTKDHYDKFEYEYTHYRGKNRWDFVDIIGWDTIDRSSRNKILFALLDKGFIEREKDFTAPNTKIIIEILNHIDEMDDKITQAQVILQQLEKKFPNYNVKKVLDKMKNTLANGIPDILIGRDTLGNKILPSISITQYGKEILQKYYETIDIFTNTPHKQELLHENYMVFEMKQMGEFKDAIIKMGSIIEYVVYIWLSSNSHPVPSDFQGKLNFMEHHSRSTPKFPISAGNWRIVNSLIRDYRNFIHLQKYFDDNISLSQRDFIQLSPIYQDILKELS